VCYKMHKQSKPISSPAFWRNEKRNIYELFEISCPRFLFIVLNSNELKANVNMGALFQSELWGDISKSGAHITVKLFFQKIML